MVGDIWQKMTNNPFLLWFSVLIFHRIVLLQTLKMCTKTIQQCIYRQVSKGHVTYCFKLLYVSEKMSKIKETIAPSGQNPGLVSLTRILDPQRSHAIPIGLTSVFSSKQDCTFARMLLNYLQFILITGYFRGPWENKDLVKCAQGFKSVSRSNKPVNLITHNKLHLRQLVCNSYRSLWNTRGPRFVSMYLHRTLRIRHRVLNSKWSCLASTRDMIYGSNHVFLITCRPVHLKKCYFGQEMTMVGKHQFRGDNPS